MSRISVPVKTVNGEQWADLGALAIAHDIVGEKVDKKDDSFSFAGGHRVRLYKFKKNVHFKVPTGTTLDITAVSAPNAPAPRRAGHG